jgi:hypothetical protein
MVRDMFLMVAQAVRQAFPESTWDYRPVSTIDGRLILIAPMSLI